MAFCQNCGSQIPDGTGFCQNCGAAVNGAQPQQPNYQQPNYQQPGYQQPGYQQPGYQQPGYQQPGYQQPGYGMRGGISFGQRNIALAIVLSIITCGIYGIIWTIHMVDELNEASNTPSAPSGGTVVLLSIVTCGIYMIVWLYKAGEQVNRAKAIRGLLTDSNTGIIYLLLAIFGLSIVSYALIQSELNKIAAFHGAPPA